MALNRRQFLTGFLSALGAFAASSASAAAAPKQAPQRLPVPDRILKRLAALKAQQKAKASTKASLPKPDYSADTQILLDSFFPMLKVNEGESLRFYRDIRQKVTVGYGTNVQSNPQSLADITIFRDGKALTPAERTTFINSFKAKTDDELKRYTITRPDATKLAYRDMHRAVKHLANTLYRGGKSYFFEMPLCMQALCLDVLYNVGVSGFRDYKKLRTALQARNYTSATSEAVVYADPETKTKNEDRERRKKRLLCVMKIVQANAGKSLSAISTLLQQDYTRSVPALTRVLTGKTDMNCEFKIASGELLHIRLEKQRLMARSAKKKGPTLSPRISPRVKRGMEV